MKRNILFTLFLMLPAQALFAAASVPGTDIWLLDLKAAGETLAVSSPRNLTARPGYDNQPAFVTTHSFLFTSMDGTGQTDVWRYDLQTGKAARLLETPESEYSPTPAPAGSVSVVRVSLAGVQQLWTLAPGAQRYEVLFPMLEGVGYHAWIDTERAALFVVRNPPELHIANRVTGEVMILAKDIGRSLQPVRGSDSSVAFTEPGEDGVRWIKQLDLAGNRITSLAPQLEGSEDFVFLPDGSPVMASNRSLYVWRNGKWQVFAQLDALPGGITRLAISPDSSRLLIVVAEGE